MEQRTRNVLAVTAAPSLNPGWLIPRLAAFQEHYPDIDVRLETSPGLEDLERSGFDIALRSGDGRWPGLIAHKLADFRLTPLCSPGFVERHGPFNRPDDLLSTPLIERDDPAWPRWFAAAGLPEVELTGGPALRLATRNLYGEAALASRGVALLMPLFYAAELVQGRLVRPFETVLNMEPSAYWFSYPASQRRARPIRLLRDWLLKQMSGG